MFKNIDTFIKNIILVFCGTFLGNFLNLLYQFLIAHKLSSSDFAAFNSLLSVFMLISAPMGTLQFALAKYCAEFNAKGQIAKVKFLLSDFFKKTSILAVITFLILCSFAQFIINVLKNPCVSCGYILALLLGLSWITPVFLGGLQGSELFGWFTLASILSSGLKLTLAAIFILSGYNIAGALGALLGSILIGIIISYLPLKNYICLKYTKEDVDYKQIFIYLLPVAISYFCFIALVTSDIILVNYFFNPFEAGLYSLAQMVGKVFLFLPGAISIVMFPKTSGLNAKNMDTASTLHRALLYAGILCSISSLIYNLFPVFILKILTGKVFYESIMLGRLFSISMSLFALLFILISYFLSIRELRFIKYLTLSTCLQFFAIVLFHRSLMQIQLVLCVNALLLFLIHFFLTYKKER